MAATEMISGRSVWGLPGPRAFLSDVRDSLAENAWLQQLVVAVPGTSLFAGLADQIEALPSPRSVRQVSVSAETPGSVIGLLLEAIGVPLPERVPTVQDLMTPACSNHLFVVDARGGSELQLEELGSTVKSLAEAAHNAKDYGERPQIAAIVPGRTAHGLEAGPRLSVLWWWGRMSRLDSLMLLQSGETGCDEATSAAISEVAVFDLAMAVYLQQAWDGGPDSLAKVVAAYPGAAGLHQYELIERRTPASWPGHDLLAAWSAGACDAWGPSGVVMHPCVLAEQDADQLKTRVWRAQASTLLPVIEEERRRVVRWLDGLGHGSELRKVAEGPVEIGDVWHYMMFRAQMKERSQMRLVHWLRDARNELAHLGCLNEHRIAEGRSLITRTELGVR